MKVPRITLSQVEGARDTLKGVVSRTPTVPASGIDEDLFLKLECLQPTGSFKVRGAWNRMSRSTDEEKKNGFVTVSAGNHGAAVAWSARRLNSSCTVYVYQNAVQRKVDSMESMGAKIIRRPHKEIMDSMSDDRMFELGMTYIHPFADPYVVAGQGTIGLEILEETPGVKSVVVPVGGGGLINGIAQAIKRVSPGVKLYGVQAEGAAPLPKSLETGVPEDVGEPKTIADGIGATRVYGYMLPLFQENLAGAFTVNDDEMRAAMKRLMSESHVIAEPAGAAPLAAVLKHPDLPKPAVCVISGGNADPKVLTELMPA